jgi:predicted Zn-dependent protease
VRFFTFILLICLANTFGGCASAGASWSHWASARGGLLQDARAIRADRIGQRVARGTVDQPICIHVLATREVTAYSFPTGDILLTSGLMDRATDDELAGAIAHELGHLLSDGHLQGPVALREKGQDPDAEARADAVGCEVLELHGIPPAAMIQALQLVANSDTSRQSCADLCRRIGLLQSQIIPPAP